MQRGFPNRVLLRFQAGFGLFPHLGANGDLAISNQAEVTFFRPIARYSDVIRPSLQLLYLVCLQIEQITPLLFIDDQEISVLDFDGLYENPLDICFYEWIDRIPKYLLFPQLASCLHIIGFDISHFPAVIRSDPVTSASLPCMSSN